MTDSQERGLQPSSDGRMSFGQSNLRPQDVVMPRVKVVQQMSKEAQGGKEAKAEPGDFYNTLTGENFGRKLVVQPIHPVMQRILLVRSNTRDEVDEGLTELALPPLTEGDGLKCRSFDMIHGRGEPGILCEGDDKQGLAPCPLSLWREGRKPPLCTETYNVVAATELGDLVVLSFSKSSAKVGKRFFSAVRLSGAAPWARFFTLTTTETTNDQGTFFVPDFTIEKERPDTAQIAQAIRWAKEVQGVEIDVTPVEEDAGEPGEEVGAAPAPGQEF